METDALEELAKSNVGMCCGTLCQPSHVKKYIDHLEEQNQMLNSVLAECLLVMESEGIEINYDS